MFGKVLNYTNYDEIFLQVSSWYCGMQKKKKKKKKKKGTHTHTHTHTHKSLNLLIIFSSNKKSLTASLKLQYCKEWFLGITFRIQ